MLSCKEVSQLVSQSLDSPLPLRRRFSVRLHLLMCSLCARFRRQMVFLWRASRAFARAEEAGRLPVTAGLSPEARERIKRARGQSGL
jgi:hypothetical protein